TENIRSKVNYYLSGGTFIDAFADPDPLVLTEALPRYSLTIQSSPAGGGTVDANPAAGLDGKYDSGTPVTLTANANTAAGDHFTSWGGEAGGTTSPLQVVMTGDKNVTANFALNDYTLTYTAGPNGNIQGTSPQTVTHGGSGTAVTAVPATGYHFV